VTLDHRQAGEEHGVEERRRVLANTAADALAQDAVAGDHGGVVEAAVHATWADRLVEREDLAWLHDGPVNQLGRQGDVRRAPGVGGVEVGRELGAQ